MQIDPFSLLPANARRAFDMQKGDVLFRQNQAASGMYRVVSGSAALQRAGLGGDTLTLHRAVAGGLFGEASIFSASYHCDAICTKAGSAVKFAKADILSSLRSDPVFAESFARLLAVQVQRYRAHIEMLAIPCAKARILAAAKAGYFDASVTELASRINLSREACYRALRKLCGDGKMIKVGRGKYALL